MSRDEAARHQLAAEGPIVVADQWLRLILNDANLGDAWALTAPDLRRKLADAWVRANLRHPALQGRNPQQLTASLAAMPSSDPLWPGFEETQIGEFCEAWSDIDLDRYGPATDPRPFGPDLEGVVFVDTTQPGFVEQDGILRVAGDEGDMVPMRGKTFLMRHFPEAPDAGVSLMIEGSENRWRVAGLEYNEPGR